MADCIIGDNAASFTQLCIASCILAELLRSGPRALSVAELGLASGHAVHDIDQVCLCLSSKGILRQDTGGRWLLAGSPDSVTLADLFAALLIKPVAAASSQD